MAKKIRKEDYIAQIISKYSDLQPHFREAEKLRKNHKERINPVYTRGMTFIKNRVGTYKRGARAGALKMNERSLNNLTLDELRKLNNRMNIQQQTQMYSSLDKEIRQNAWDLAYTSFVNASKYNGTKKAKELELRRRNMSEEDYRNMTYLFEKMEGDLLHAYGSEVAEVLYEETEGNFDTDTLMDVLYKGIEMGHLASAGVFGKAYSKQPNAVSNDFVTFWSSYKFEHPRASLTKAAVEFYKDMTGDYETKDAEIKNILEKEYD